MASQTTFMQPRLKVVNVDSNFESTSGYAWQEQGIAASGGELVLCTARTQDELIAACSDAEIVVVEHPDTPISAQVIAKLSKCIGIVKCAVGFDNIDIEAASQCGIVVCHVPDYCTEEVSDHTVALLLTALRRICSMHRNIQSGGWEDTAPAPPMRRIRNLTLGLLGFGRIGRAVARKMSGFQMRMLAADPNIGPESLAFGVELVTRDRLFRESDVVSVHVGLTTETRKMVGTAEIECMKRSAVVVNTSRGAVVDEEALICALQVKRIAGAALDVLTEEPLPANSPLRRLPNVVLTPHCSANSDDSLTQWRDSVADSLEALLKGYWPEFPVNPHVILRTALRPWPSFQAIKRGIRGVDSSKAQMNTNLFDASVDR